ncbi:hypothetical protein Bca101_019794 [Brassica carinata]
MVIGDYAVLSSSSLVDDRIFLSLANYGEVENGTKKQNFLIDVIGRIHELGAVQTVQVSGEDRKRVQFRLVDAEYFFTTFFQNLIHRISDCIVY